MLIVTTECVQSQKRCIDLSISPTELVKVPSCGATMQSNIKSQTHWTIEILCQLILGRFTQTQTNTHTHSVNLHKTIDNEINTLVSVALVKSVWFNGDPKCFFIWCHSYNQMQMTFHWITKCQFQLQNALKTICQQFSFGECGTENEWFLCLFRRCHHLKLVE